MTRDLTFEETQEVIEKVGLSFIVDNTEEHIFWYAEVK